MPVGLAIPALRGIFNLPSAIAQEGVGGVSTAFFNPERVERTRRVQGAREENQPEEREIDRIIAEAQSAEDLEPAFGLFMQLQQQAVDSGIVNSEAEYNQVISPVMGRLGAAARRFITGDSAAQARGVLGLGARLGSERLSAEGEQLSRLAGREAQGQAAMALAGLRGAQQQQVPERTELIGAQADAARAAAEASRARAAHYGQPDQPPQPKLGDLDRLDREIRTRTQQAGAVDQRTGAAMPPPPQPLIEERNQRAAELGRPALFALPAGEGYDTREVAPEVVPVARQLLYGSSPPPMPEETPATPPMAAPVPTPAPQRRIEIPDVMRQRAAAGTLRTSELLAYYRQLGLSDQDAVAAARAAAQELTGAGSR